MKLNTKKLAKIITLAITSMLIATVSAASYKYMYLDGGIIIGGATMAWYSGGDGDTSISGKIATVNLEVEQGVPNEFPEVLFLENLNATGSYNINITINTVVLGADFDECSMHIYTNASSSWVFVNTIDLTDSADFYSGTLDAGDFLRMSFDVNATASASGTKDFDVQFRYD